MILPVQSIAGTMHVWLCLMKTVYMIPQVLPKAGIIHEILCQMNNVYMIPPL